MFVRYHRRMRNTTSICGLLLTGGTKKKAMLSPKNAKLKFFNGDIRKPSAIADITVKINYIIHCAAITKSADMVEKPEAKVRT